MRFKSDESDKTIAISVLAILISLGVTVNSFTKKSERANVGQEHNEYIAVDSNYVVPSGYKLVVRDGQAYGERTVVIKKKAIEVYGNGEKRYVTNAGKLVLGDDGQYYEVYYTKEYVNAIKINDDNNTLKLSK